MRTKFPLDETRSIAAISSRLVVNKAAMRSRHAAITRIIADLTAAVREVASAAP